MPYAVVVLYRSASVPLQLFMSISSTLLIRMSIANMPTKVWYYSQLHSYVTTINADQQQVIAKTNNKLIGLALNGSFSSLLGKREPNCRFDLAEICHKGIFKLVIGAIVCSWGSILLELYIFPQS